MTAAEQAAQHAEGVRWGLDRIAGNGASHEQYAKCLADLDVLVELVAGLERECDEARKDAEWRERDARWRERECRYATEAAEARVRELTAALEALKAADYAGHPLVQDGRSVQQVIDGVLAAAGEPGEERQATEQEVKRNA